MKDERHTISSLTKALDQGCLGMFLQQLEYREKLLKNNETTFFSLITPTHTTSQSRATQMDSQPGHRKGVTTYWATQFVV